MFVGNNDLICDPIVAARESEKISTLQNFYTIKDAGHGFAQSNKKDFVGLLQQELVTIE